MAGLKVLLMGASLETKNMGVSALAVGAMQSFCASNPSGSITLLDYAKKDKIYSLTLQDCAARVQLLSIRFSWKFFLKNNIAYLIGLAWLAKLLPRKRYGRALIENNLVLKQIEKADFITALSGGDSFSDIYGMRRLLYGALPQILVITMEKPLVLLPQTVGPFTSTFAKTISRFILSRAALVYMRDHDSMEDVLVCLGTSVRKDRFRFGYDMGFALQPTEPKEGQYSGRKEAMGRPLIGLNVSGLLYRGGYSGDNMFGLQIDYPRLVEDVIDIFIEKKNASVILVPHVFGDDENGESDIRACKSIYEKLQCRHRNRLFLVEGNYDQSEIKYVIGQCDFFIGSRMHACIAAISQSVPAVSIAYSRKFRGVMDTLGMGEYVADPRTMTDEEIFELINKAYFERSSTREKLEKEMPKIKMKVLDLFKEIWDELSNKRTR